VTAKPVITAQPAGQTVEEGKSVTLTVAASGSGLTYQWLKDGSKLPSATAASLTIPAATKADEGSYSCDVSDACGTTSSSTALLRVSGSTSVHGDDVDGQLVRILGPQPARDVVSVLVRSSSDDQLSIEFLDVQGREVLVLAALSVSPGEQTLAVSVRELPDGMYLLRTRNSFGAAALPLIIHR
jgi:hypothetical protein